MASRTSTSDLVLHIWPGHWGLPSFDPLCVAAVLYLQQAVPGQFILKECSNPDVSPTGQLPFLLHEQHSVASFPSIVKYVSGLRNADYKTYPNANLDANLSPREKAQRTAWSAHAESHLGDIVYHYLYSNQDNWMGLTRITLASMFAVPQKYYAPTRIRDTYHQRLLAAGLWKPFADEPLVDSPFAREIKPVEKKKQEIKKNPALSQAFEREKVLEKARTELDIYRELLDDKDFIFQDRLSSIDILLAAHIILLTDPPYPDPVLKDLVTETYPTLLAHARRVFDEAFGQGRLTVATISVSSSFWNVIPSWPKTGHNKKYSSPEDIKDAQLRWGFLGLVLGSFVAYLVVVVPKYIQWVPVEKLEAEEEEEEDDDDDAEGGVRTKE
ncbi:hypothetical protein BDN70DRAFT_953795 [Pholiota conissans]|uniref:Mitochondrial outer membrane transport complex Sam37/metaxin N-terminal domain-containing protein n=1 Tax=Pholiota conissans TaxID=109636 RepID=A0A9P5YU75_9AGAR|nr:hypothetical protein BDN70DRAFT_953795 [Pholiota conissans]